MSESSKPMIFQGTSFANGVEAAKAAEVKRVRQQGVLLMGQNEIVDLEVWMKESAETEKSILVFDGTMIPTHEFEKALTGKSEKAKEFWLPKSQCEWEVVNRKTTGELIEIILTLPRWLAEQKELV